MERFRSTVRIVCLDDASSVLLGCWHDVVDGTLLWELPGGGIEEGESTLEAARRELFEETGLTAEIEATDVIEWRDVWWLGVHYLGPEPFFLLRGVDPGSISPAALLSDELETFVEYRWVTPESLPGLNGRLENPGLAEIIAKLAPDSPWAAPH